LLSDYFLILKWGEKYDDGNWNAITYFGSWIYSDVSVRREKKKPQEIKN